MMAAGLVGTTPRPRGRSGEVGPLGPDFGNNPASAGTTCVARGQADGWARNSPACTGTAFSAGAPRPSPADQPRVLETTTSRRWDQCRGGSQPCVLGDSGLNSFPACFVSGPTPRARGQQLGESSGPSNTDGTTSHVWGSPKGSLVHLRDRSHRISKPPAELWSPSLGSCRDHETGEWDTAPSSGAEAVVSAWLVQVMEVVGGS